jgi:hypothetical protein
MGTVVPYAQGLLIMIYIQNVVNLIASFIQQYNLFSSHASFHVHFLLYKIAYAMYSVRVTSFQGLSFWTLFPGKKRRALITHKI